MENCVCPICRDVHEYNKEDYFGKYLEACPLCGSERPFIINKGDKTFHDRRGCLDCNKWIDGVHFKDGDPY